MLTVMVRPVGTFSSGSATAQIPPDEAGEAQRDEEATGRSVELPTLGVALADAVIEQIEISVKYAGYIVKQNDEVERAARYEHLILPAELDYAQVHALSYEVRQTLSRHRPETLGQASRMSGVTPAAISLLLVHLKKGRFAGFGDAQSSRDVRGASELADAA